MYLQEFYSEHFSVTDLYSDKKSPLKLPVFGSDAPYHWGVSEHKNTEILSRIT